ncbi:MAG: hypothetical protein ACKPB4_04880, partial [Sphaerospermopsis kisseleviana]
HLTNKNILIQRHTDIINIPFLKTQNNQTVKTSESTISETKLTTEKIDIIIRDLLVFYQFKPHRVTANP